MERNEIINNLKNVKENHFYKDCTVKNVKVGDKEGDYCRISLTIDKEVEQCVVDQETNEIKHQKSNVIFASSISILAVLKENDDAAFAANYISEHNKSLEAILSRAKIDVVQEFVPDGKEYKNPFSSKEDTRIFEGDRYITHITDITLGKIGLQSLEKVQDKILSI